jgi:hypothetical protein
MQSTLRFPRLHAKPTAVPSPGRARLDEVINL